MAHYRWLAALAVAGVLLPGSARAQGVTTAAVSGTVTDETGQPVADAQIQVLNTATGYSTGTMTRADGRYNVLGLEVGGPYTVRARRIGYAPEERTGFVLTLGQNLRLDLRLGRQAVVLTGVTVTADRDALISSSRTGAQTLVSDTALRRLPTLNRNFTDFVALTPQVSVSGPGISGGGVNNRYNNIQIDGAIASDIFGLGSTGQPGGQAGGKVISLEAVKEYQVLLTPFDVRQGNFAGALVNAVTKSGTNQFHGTAFYYTRNEGLARNVEYLPEYEQTQLGFSLGGPIVRDRVHFFVAPEFTRRTQPAFGPYLGSADQPVPSDTVQRFISLLQGYGINGGSAGLVQNKNPLDNAFARIDVAALPFNSRAVISYNYSFPKNDVFSRSDRSFPLTSFAYQFESRTSQPKLQLFSNFANGAANELSLAATFSRDKRRPDVVAPMITVQSRSVGLVAGADRFSQGNALDQDILELKDDVTFPVGAHTVTIGTQNQFYNIYNLFSRDSYGVYTFGNLDSLALGLPNSYSVGLQSDPRYPVRVHMRASQFALYAQDQWQPARGLSLTVGLRADIPVLNTRPPRTELVATNFGRNTDEVPSGNVQWSPRLGFNWDVTGDQTNQLRGGVGMFVGRPAFVWISNAYQNSGSGLGLLNCTNRGATAFSGAGRAPAFDPDPTSQPTACANGAGLSSYRDQIDLLSQDLKFPQTLRLTLGYDRRLPLGLVGTLEGIWTRNVNDFFYLNRNLAGPQGVDARGRVMYGTIGATGQSSPTRVSSSFGNIIEAVNTSRNYSYNLTAQLQRRFENNFEARAAYTFSRVRDAQSPTSSQGISNWRFGRTLSGRHDDQEPTISLFDQPHKIVLAGTYSLPTRTDVSLYYIGQSGQPYDYVYGGFSGRGDLNADGSQGNDLFYVPRSATDSSQIVVETVATAQALEEFIENTDCLRESRGRIMERNSCRTPWQNIMNLTLRQSLPQFRGQNVALEVGVFNLLNLLNREWGLQQFTPGGFSNVNIVTHTGMVGTVPRVTFNPNAERFNARNAASNYQIQLSARYSF